MDAAAAVRRGFLRILALACATEPTATDHAPVDNSGLAHRKLNDGREFQIVKVWAGRDPCNRAAGSFYLANSAATDTATDMAAINSRQVSSSRHVKRCASIRMKHSTAAINSLDALRAVVVAVA